MARTLLSTEVHGAADSAAGRTLLLVEDEVDAREVLARKLGAWGWRCLAHPDTDSALSDPHLASTDAVVADVVLRSVTNAGIELIAALRNRNVDAPVVLMTAFANSEMLLRALDAGAAFFIEKPFAIPELCGALETAISRQSNPLMHAVDLSLARARLTKKEEQIARLALRGLTSIQIAAMTGNAAKTVKQHLTEVYAKLGVSTRAEFFHLVFPT